MKAGQGPNVMLLAPKTYHSQYFLCGLSKITGQVRQRDVITMDNR